jgi:hypothetical protein
MPTTSLPKQEPAQDEHQTTDAAGNDTALTPDCGVPAHTLPDQRSPAAKGNIAHLLAMPTAFDVGFEAPRANIAVRPADFT